MAKMAIIYWSGTGNTKTMAEAIAQGANAAGAEVELMEIDDTTPEEALQYDLLALGCPAMGDEQLEEAEFEPFFEELEDELGGKKLAIFGSYEWNDGQWMIDWAERCKEAGALLHTDEGLAVYDAPTDEDVEKCKQFGESFANA